MLCLGAWDQNGRADDEIHPPEFLVAGDVLRGDAAATLGQGTFVARVFFCGNFLV